jgi:hypothetical protein
MTTECTVVPGGDPIKSGDAVCVVGFDDVNYPQHPILVAGASAATIATSKTVFGVSHESTAISAEKAILVSVSGEVVENDITGLGPGDSRIVGTKIDHSDPARQAGLQRIERPDGSELAVGTCDKHGNLAVQPRASIDTSAQHVYNVRAYGASPNWNGNKPTNDGTANFKAFTAALAAMKADNNKTAKLVADGWFYLSEGLALRQAIVFEGAGSNEPTAQKGRSAPGTWLIFPKNVTGIRLHTQKVVSRKVGNEETIEILEDGADGTLLRNLTISSMEGEGQYPLGQSGHGIHMNTLAYLENVTVEWFGGHGIFVDAGHLAAPGNAGGFVLRECNVARNGGDGIHVRGGDATVGHITSCQSRVNYGYGFRDNTAGTSLYSMCHGALNTGYTGNVGVSADYKTDGGSNGTVFLQCYTESGANEVSGAALVIGGGLSQSSYNTGTACLIGPRGDIAGSPLSFEKPTGSILSSIHFGQRTGDPGVLTFELSAAHDEGLPDVVDWARVGYEATFGWWSVESSSSTDSSTNSSRTLRLPTSVTRPRRTAPLFENGIFYGQPLELRDERGVAADPLASRALTNHIGRSAIPVDGTWEKGDVVWNTDPVPGGPIGWVCVAAGTCDNSPEMRTSSSIAAGVATVKVDDPNPLRQWQYITIAGLEGIYQIVNDPVHAPTVAFSPGAAGSVAATAAVYYHPARFWTVGAIENVGVSTSYGTVESPHTLMRTERYVTIKSDATMTLPAPAADGQTYDIKSQAGVTTMVDPNGSTIDGRAGTVTLASGQRGCFRYSVTAGEWERR